MHKQFTSTGLAYRLAQSSLPCVSSYFDPKRRDLAAAAYLAAVSAQRLAQRRRTVRASLLIATCGIALGLGLAVRDTFPALGLCLCIAATIAILCALLLPID